MPIYEYYCSKCQIDFELMLSFSQSNSPALCPKCKAEARRLLSSFACKNGSNFEMPEKPSDKDPRAFAQSLEIPATCTRGYFDYLFYSWLGSGR
jgi:putative FmdB family regulatory protein